jgi:hypothetical protein
MSFLLCVSVRMRTLRQMTNKMLIKVVRLRGMP